MQAATYLSCMDALDHINTKILAAKFSKKAEYAHQGAMLNLLHEIEITVRTAVEVIQFDSDGHGGPAVFQERRALPWRTQ